MSFFVKFAVVRQMRFRNNGKYIPVVNRNGTVIKPACYRNGRTHEYESFNSFGCRANLAQCLFTRFNKSDLSEQVATGIAA